MKFVSFREKLKSLGYAVAAIFFVGLLLWSAVADFFGDGPVTDAQREKEYQESLIYEQGYEAGLEAGREDGYEDGFDEGHSEGYDEGYDVGYQEGYDRGYDNGYEDCWYDN